MSADSATPGAVRAFRYWPHGEPIPPGWRVTDGLARCHHGYHALLLIADDEPNVGQETTTRPDE
jgi:hypothetical protein